MLGKNETRFYLLASLIVAIAACIAAWLVVPLHLNPLQRFIGDRLTTITLLDKFNGFGVYDSKIWDCGNECDIENLELKDGMLQLQRKSSGFSALMSHSKWLYSNVYSLTGKFQISSSANYSVGWIGMSPNIRGCFIGNLDDVQLPYIQCESGPEVGSIEKYTSPKLFIEFDRWYQMTMEFDQDTANIRFYIDNKLAGEYILINHPNSAQVSLGIFSNENIQSNSKIYMDDITVRVKK